MCLLGTAVGQQYGCRVVILMVLNYDVTQNNLCKTTKSIEANKLYKIYGHIDLAFWE
jgi:hypothetical protein